MWPIVADDAHAMLTGVMHTYLWCILFANIRDISPDLMLAILIESEVAIVKRVQCQHHDLSK